MELTISGRSKGLAAASAINDFLLVQGTMTHALQAQLKSLPALALPFDVLGIYVEAIDHTEPSSIPITVFAKKKLVRSRDGQSQKMFELTIGNGYYQLDAPTRREAICRALLSIAESLGAEFPSADGHALAESIRRVAETHASTAG